MEWMDRYRRVGGWGWVVMGTLLQGVGLAAGWADPGVVTWLLVAEVAALAVVMWVRPGSRTAGLLGRVTAVLLALDLAGAVADRFGAFGRPGRPGVSWGDWSRFQEYTAVLLHHPGQAAVTAAAMSATAAEIALALLLASGWWPRLVGKATAGLFSVYMLAMAAIPVRADVVRYALPFLIGGALLLSATATANPTGRPTTVKETAYA